MLSVWVQYVVSTQVFSAWSQFIVDSTQVVSVRVQHIVFFTQVVSEGVDGGSSSGGDTKVELNILNSPPLLLTIPAGVELQDPAFINFVAQEALEMYKQMFR